MKTTELCTLIEESLIERTMEYSKKILENMKDFYIYENREFICINDLENEYKNWIIEELKENRISKVIFDEVSKKNVEKYRTIVVSEDCKGALIYESTLIGMINLEYNNIMIIKSRMTGTRTRIFLNSLIENSNIIGCALALVHIDGSNAFDSNINMVIVGKMTLINSGCFIANGVRIKENVMIGPKTNLVVNTYEPHRPLEYYAGCTESENDVLEVGDNVWFGASSNVVKSVNIGHWALISAGSIITKDVPEFCLHIKEKNKSIIDRIKKVADSDEFLIRILKGDYPGGHETGELYSKVKNLVSEWEEADLDLRLYYIYTHTEFLKNGKRVEAMGKVYELKYTESLFEFLTPDLIDIDFEKNIIKVEYKKTYDKISKLREKFIQNLFKFAEVETVNVKEFKVEITEDMKNKMIKMDNIFNNELKDLIKSYGIPLEDCKIDLNVLEDELKK